MSHKFPSPGDLDQKAEAWYDLPQIFQAGSGADGDSMSSNVATSKPSRDFFWIFSHRAEKAEDKKKAASRRLKIVDCYVKLKPKVGTIPMHTRKFVDNSKSVSHDS